MTRKRDLVFISYSHKDRSFMQRLRTHLKPLVRKESLSVWVDEDILPGGQWKQEIDAAVKRARVAVLLVSPDFLASDFINKYELIPFLKASEREDVTVFWVPISHSAWGETDIAPFQAGHSPARPLDGLAKPQREKAYVQIAKKIQKAYDAYRPPDIGPLVPGAYREFLEGKLANLDPVLATDQALNFRLRGVYVPLSTDWQEPERLAAMEKGSKSQKEPKKERKPLEHLTRHPKHRHFVVVGDPGSGKTTFLKHTALNEVQGEKQLPLLLALKDLGAWLASQTGTAGELLPRWAGSVYGGQGLGAEAITARCGEGKVLWLLDGLDEIFDPALRLWASKIIGAWFGSKTGAANRLIVTTRPHALRQQSILSELGIKSGPANVSELERDEQRTFLDKWFLALLGEKSSDQAKRAVANLWDALERHDELEDKRGNPLMLSTIATIYHMGKRLPERRADLYGMAVEILLRHRFGANAGGSEDEVWLLREGLMVVALEMFKRGLVREIGHGDFLKLLGQGYFRDQESTPVQRVTLEKRAEELGCHSGLLSMEGYPPKYRFRHLGFQEYLAARACGDQRVPIEALKDYLDDDAWREVILLTAGYLFESPPTYHGTDFLEGLRNHWQKGTRPYHRLAMALRATAETPRRWTPKPLIEELRTQAVTTLGTIDPKAEEADRNELGHALGKLGDHRLDPTQEKRWVRLDPGSFQMGMDEWPSELEDFLKTGSPAHQVHITRGFWLGKYPVTHEEYAAFMRDGGYQNQAWWEEAGWQWCGKEKITKPDYWHDARFRGANQPVVGVSWYEADAYCRWLTARLRQQGKPWWTEGWVVRLPTEAEWEYAARSPQSNLYTWGNHEPSSHLACYGGRTRGTAPVGVYPAGATPEGMMDMAGNVDEWCLDPWEEEPYRGRRNGIKDPVCKGDSSVRVPRGGAWGDPPLVLLAPVRLGSRAGGRGGFIGFRCCLGAVPEHG